jgi:uncharacterized DUF497 family protein
MVTYEWDDHKATTNERKHGTGFAEGASVFDDPMTVSIADPDHSQSEDRWISIGMAATGRLLVVVHTRSYVDESHEVIRLISARPATSRERRVYTNG